MSLTAIILATLEGVLLGSRSLEGKKADESEATWLLCRPSRLTLLIGFLSKVPGKMDNGGGLVFFDFGFRGASDPANRKLLDQKIKVFGADAGVNNREAQSPKGKSFNLRFE